MQFFVVPEVKKKLHDVRLQSVEAAAKAYMEHVESIPASEWSSCFEQRFHRMQTGVDSAGEDFEKV